jgi:hypothetical protein
MMERSESVVFMTPEGVFEIEGDLEIKQLSERVNWEQWDSPKDME